MLTTYSGEKALFKSLTISLIINEKITTTLAKAKKLRGYIDRAITAAKKKNFVSYGVTVSMLGDKKALKKLHEILVPRYESRSSGYTQIFKLGERKGDSASMALIKLMQ
jgi:large subunit ribosomal protein L17